MAKRDWALVEALASALGQSHTPRALPKAVGIALGPRWDARTVRLEFRQGDEMQVFTASRHLDRWASGYGEASAPTSPTGTAILRKRKSTSTLTLPIAVGAAAGQLVVRFGAAGELVQGAPEYLAALARVLEVGIGYQFLVQRVADLSRHAHVENRMLKESLDHSGLVARSPKMLAVVERVAMVARYV